jgi:hypothetical protein
MLRSCAGAVTVFHRRFGHQEAGDEFRHFDSAARLSIDFMMRFGRY